MAEAIGVKLGEARKGDVVELVADGSFGVVLASYGYDGVALDRWYAPSGLFPPDTEVWLVSTARHIGRPELLPRPSGRQAKVPVAA